MKVVIACEENMNYVTFETKISEPWTYLAQVARDIPQVLDKPIRFSKKIPENTAKYVLWECNGNENAVIKQTDNIKEAVRFLKPRRPFRTLGELLKKYAAK